MLRNNLRVKLAKTSQVTLGYRLTKLITLLSSLSPFILSVSPALAQIPSIGVVKSPENLQQWPVITSRLQSLGINYCVLEQSQWQGTSDLDNVRVLFLPSVENINGAQAQALENWLNKGGQVIVSGPTGVLSQPEVKTRLRSLFGAYWGFINSSAATLNPVADMSQTSGGGLSSTLVGGVIIPSGVSSQTVAVWVTQESPPAVVTTDKSTFFGWRWGSEQVAPVSFDQAWFKFALNKYGVQGKTPLSLVNSSGIPCNPNNTANQPAVPILPTEDKQSINPRQNVPIQTTTINPSKPETPNVLLANRDQQSFNFPAAGLSPQQVQEMTEELQALIARVESTLLAAEANNNGLPAPTDKLIEQSIKHRENTGSVPSINKNNRSYQALKEAREGLKNFQQLVQNQQYDEARQLWLKARRNLWDNYPTDRQFAQPEIRAMWLDRGTIVQAKSEEELAKVFDRMAQAGINVVFFETVNASYTIYPSNVAPEQNPLTKGWDPLKAAIKLAHERKMELHAWVWIFAAANQRHNEVLGQPLDYLGPVLSRNPEWANVNKEGGYFDYSQGYKKAFFDPANPKVQGYLLSLLEEIVMNYDVDGVQFDYIRYPFQSPNKKELFGYSNSSRWLFKEMTGIDPIEIEPGQPLWNQWTQFRIRQVDSFVATASARLKQRKPNLIISAAVFPMERRDRLFNLQQNWEDWGKNNWVDAIFLMTYAMDTGSFEDRIKPLQEYGVAGASLVIPGLRLLKVPDPVTIDQMQLVRNMPTSGFALFAAENLTPNLEEIFNRTQGAVTTKQTEPVPLREPFQVATARYQALQREWSFLLVNNQLTMDEATMKQWARYGDAVAKSLNQLAQQPNYQNFNAAKTNLSRFRQQFGNWMRQHQRVHPYQVQVWDNRLETLEQLLNYGERRILQQQAQRR